MDTESECVCELVRERLAELLSVLRCVINKQQALNSEEILSAAGALIAKVKGQHTASSPVLCDVSAAPYRTSIKTPPSDITLSAESSLNRFLPTFPVIRNTFHCHCKQSPRETEAWRGVRWKLIEGGKLSLLGVFKHLSGAVQLENQAGVSLSVITENNFRFFL